MPGPVSIQEIDAAGRDGEDPESLMTTTSHTTCATRLETAVCAFCRGTGRDPFDIMSSRSACCVCGGRGSVRVPTPHVRCAHCGGSGAVKTLTCTVCGGKGVLAASGDATTACPECRGSGDDGSAPALACLACHGRGWIRSAATRTDRERMTPPEEVKGTTYD